jgi:hypothetical protein
LSTREVKPVEQHVHSMLEMMPLTGLLLVIALWQPFVALFGFAPACFDLMLKPEPLPLAYIATILGLTLLFEVLPYFEELLRGLRHSRANPSVGHDR